MVMGVVDQRGSEYLDEAVVPSMPDWLAGRPDPDDAPWPTFDELFAELERVKADALDGAEAAPEPIEAWRLDDAGLVAELGVAFRALTATQSRWLALLAAADRRQVAGEQDFMTTASWLAAGTTHSARAARADVRLANMLAARPLVTDALAAGSVSTEQASAIVSGLQHLPGEFDPATVEAITHQMLKFAAEFNPDGLRRLVNHAIEVAAPEVADDHARNALARAERAQRRGRHVGWRTDADDGSLRFWGKLPAAEGELFTQHLSALACGQRSADAEMGVETSQAQALADSLALVVGHHASCQGGPVKGGDQTRVMVTVSLDDLRTGAGLASLVESGEPITAGQARRLACSAGIMPVVLDGASVILDLGRSQRLFSPQQRAAMAVRDGGCTFPSCDQPPADCEAHHATNPWRAGGLTNLADGVLLCPHHHHLVEPDLTRPDHENWQITFDARGKAVFHTPVGLDGQRIVKQHHRYRT